MRIEDVQVIEAPVAKVWDLTVDVEHLPAVTPTMTSVERLDDGPIGVGSRARIKQPAQRPAVWTVTRFEPGSTFEWETRVLGMRMVGGHHLEAVDGGTRNTLVVEMSGRGSGLFGRLVGSRMATAIATENEGLRRAAEGN
jgi:uncharacterized membrane protein